MDIIMRLCNNYFEYLGVNFTEKFLLSFYKEKEKSGYDWNSKKVIEKKREKKKELKMKI